MDHLIVILHQYLPLLLAIIPSLITALTPYPQAGATLYWLRVLLDVFSVLQHKDSPGTLALPGQRSNPPGSNLKLSTDHIPFVALLLMSSLLACATLSPILCGKDGHLVPPAAAPCAIAFLDALYSIPGDIAACQVSGFSAACIDAVIASGRELGACLPTCAPNAATGRLGAGVRVHVAANVLRTNIIESLRATGHPEAGH